MDIQKQNFLSIEQLKDRYLNQPKQAEGRNRTEGMSFQKVLEQRTAQHAGQTGELRFSKHAAGRLADRGIELSEDQMERLNDGVRRAGQKGIRDSLVIVDELAFIVNVPNSTVVTAMDSTETQDNVFTNINGAVIM